MQNRLLLVSSDGQFCQAVGLTLAKLGFSISIAPNAEEARESAEREPPHVLIADLGDEPRIDSWALAHELRRSNQGLTCLLVGNRVRNQNADPLANENRDRLAETPWISLIERPFSMMQFAEIIEKAVAKRSAVAPGASREA